MSNPLIVHGILRAAAPGLRRAARQALLLAAIGIAAPTALAWTLESLLQMPLEQLLQLRFTPRPDAGPARASSPVMIAQRREGLVHAG